MTPTEEILHSIDKRLRELDREIETLTAARAALGDGKSRRPTRSGKAKQNSPATLTNGSASPTDLSGSSQDAPNASPEATGNHDRARRRARRRGRAKSPRNADVVPAGTLELLLSQSDGVTTTALAERAKGARDQILALLRELETAGRVRRTGQRRGTRWHVVTDEERIQARASELAERRGRAA